MGCSQRILRDWRCDHFRPKTALFILVPAGLSAMFDPVEVIHTPASQSPARPDCPKHRTIFLAHQVDGVLAAKGVMSAPLRVLSTTCSPGVAHNLHGVSAQPIHRAMHRPTGRSQPAAEHCQDQRLGQPSLPFDRTVLVVRQMGVGPGEASWTSCRREDFERTPPHDLAAEQCTLGGMMLSKDAIADVLEIIKAQPITTSPAHQMIHETDPRPVRPRRARRRGDGRERAHQARR